MDAIHFDNQHIIFREQGTHTYQVGEGTNVIKITPIDRPASLFPYSPVRIDNMAGNFQNLFRTIDMDSVIFASRQSFQFNKQIYHIDATLNIHKRIVHFKGCCGMNALMRIQRDIGLHDASCRIYMCLITGNMGVLVDVNFGCYLERFFLYNFHKTFSPRIRVIDLHPVIYLEMNEWNTELFPEVPPEKRPTRMVVSVSHKGTVIFRLTWKNIIWDHPTEASMMRLCQWLMDLIKASC